MPRRSAQPPYEIFRQSPPTGSKPTQADPGSPASSNRGRRVLRLPEAGTVAAWLRRAVAGCREAGVATAVWLGERSASMRQRLAEAREQRQARRLEAKAAKAVRINHWSPTSGARDSRKKDPMAGPWWLGSGEPVVLRMTRGLVILAIAGLVGLVLFAYWLGAGENGPNFADTWPDSDQNEPFAAALDVETPANANARLDALIDVPGGSDPAAGLVVPKPRTTPPPPSDPRQPGQNYLVYTMTDLGTARELAGFLRERGARILIVPTDHPVAPDPAAGTGELAESGESRDTAWLHLVVDVTEGFTRAQYARGEYHRFLTERLQFGREWKRRNGNRGSALENMTFYKYQPR